MSFQISCLKDEKYNIRCVPGVEVNGRKACQYCDTDHLTETGTQDNTFRSHGQFSVLQYMRDINNRMPRIGIVASSGDTGVEIPGAPRKDLETFAKITQRAKDIIQKMK